MSTVQHQSITIPYQKKFIDACVSIHGNSAPTYEVILTHGAGGDMNMKQLVVVAESLARHGFMCLRFTCKGLNVVYRSKVFLEVLSYTQQTYSTLQGCFVGDFLCRSMINTACPAIGIKKGNVEHFLFLKRSVNGSRAAVSVCDMIRDTDLDPFVRGIVCLSYPLHTPDNLDMLRDEPLYSATKPILFISGTQDQMCQKGLMSDVLSKVQKKDVTWVEGADHGLKVRGEQEEETVEGICQTVLQWLKKEVEAQDTVVPKKKKRKR